VHRRDPDFEEVEALTLDDLVDVAANGDSPRALLDAEIGRGACLELLLMDETDVVFTEVSAIWCLLVSSHVCAQLRNGQFRAMLLALVRGAFHWDQCGLQAPQIQHVNDLPNQRSARE
jgi:hypothetical protein